MKEKLVFGVGVTDIPVKLNAMTEQVNACIWAAFLIRMMLFRLIKSSKKTLSKERLKNTKMKLIFVSLMHL